MTAKTEATVACDRCGLTITLQRNERAEGWTSHTVSYGPCYYVDGFGAWPEKPVETTRTDLCPECSGVQRAPEVTGPHSSRPTDPSEPDPPSLAPADPVGRDHSSSP